MQKNRTKSVLFRFVSDAAALVFGGMMLIGIWLMRRRPSMIEPLLLHGT